MSKIYKFSLAILAMLISISTIAQKSFFSDISEAQAKASSGNRVIVPVKYRTVTLDDVAIKSFLWSLPSEKNVHNRKSTPILELPMPDGRVAKFNVWESSIQEPALEAKFPDIKTFLGQGIDDPYATIRFDYTPRGFHAQVLTLNGTYYIDPFSMNFDGAYISYYRTDLIKNVPFECTVEEAINKPALQSRPQANCLGTEMRTFRLAVACTGEYAQAPGIAAGTNAAILHAAIVTSVNRVVGVYEREITARMVLIANNNLVEFLNAGTDPFTGNNNANVLINESQTVIDANIGFANYDIGHTFSTGGGGLAQLNSPCGSSKARGITGSPSPTGDAYDIDYVAHEMGHQFGGNHTMAGCGSSPNNTKYEPGSGTTIQAYAGICGAENIQPNSDPHFHAVSFDEISNFFFGGGGCGVITPTNNNLPVIAPFTNSGLTIPIGTPFTLTGTATDADGDALSYSWEEWDFSGTATWNAGATAPPGNTVPLFKSRLPKTTGSRTFPDVSVINAGFPANPPSAMNGLKGETLSPVARPMNFRLSVKDNRAGGGAVASAGSGGCQNSTPFVINVGGSAPFTLSIPNGGESYLASSAQTVTWNVVGTNVAPFNVANVKVSFSNDGGLTFPTVLLASTPNDGSESITMPSTATTTARIKVEAIGNIFFDISNANFTLTVPPNDFNFGTITAATSACPAAATMTVNIPTTSTGGFANPITLAATAGVPAGTTVTFAANPVAPGATSVATLNNASTLSAGTYTVTVTGTATGASVKTTTISFIITAGAGPALTTNSVAATVCAPATATFTVATAAAPVTYQWQSAPTVGGTYTNISTATAASYTTAPTTAGMNGMGFRCIVSTQCGTTTSTNALLTVNTAAAITTQPTNQTACTGATATFTTTASGTGVTYQWQSGTSATGPWTNVGTNSASYTTAPLTVTTPTFYQVVVATTTCAATVTSNVVTLGVSVTAAINTQPTAQIVCAGATATYTVAAVGTGVSYQWQMATAAAPTVFSNVGTNSNTFTTAATTAAMSGNIYHVIVTGSCNAVTSSNVTLTVNTSAVITTQPIAVTLCNGVAATFTAAGSGTGVTYQWQSGPSATGPWVNVTGGTGATTTTYTTAATIPAMNGTYYRMVATTTNCAAVVNSSAVLLTVNTVAVIGTQPAPQSACIPQTATFNVAATGTGLTYQWQIALAATPTVFTDITGATNASYTTGAAVLTMNGNLYRVSILSTCGAGVPTVSTPALLTVTNPVAITLQPTANSGCIGDNYTFTANASSPGNTITYQWQISNTGAAGSFVNIAGATNAPAGSPSPVSPSYNISSANSLQNGTYYRVYFSVPCGTGISTDTSAAGKLTLSLKPTIVLTAPATSNINASVNQGLFTTISPTNFVGAFNWTKNGAIIPNTLASTSILLPVDGVGTYQVSTKDATTGCIATSNAVAISVEQADNIAKDRLFVYPNPVSNTMLVRFNFPNVGTTGTVLNIYDEKGSRVMSVPYTLTGTSGRMSVNMSKVQLGTYLVYLMDASGKKLASTKVVKVQ
jgi:hypothetical protein